MVVSLRIPAQFINIRFFTIAETKQKFFSKNDLSLTRTRKMMINDINDTKIENKLCCPEIL